MTVRADLVRDIAARTGFDQGTCRAWLEARGYESLSDVPKYFFADLRSFWKARNG
jgi:hypothetical protein